MPLPYNRAQSATLSSWYSFNSRSAVYIVKLLCKLYVVPSGSLSGTKTAEKCIKFSLHLSILPVAVGYQGLVHDLPCSTWASSLDATDCRTQNIQRVLHYGLLSVKLLARHLNCTWWYKLTLCFLHVQTRHIQCYICQLLLYRINIVITEYSETSLVWCHIVTHANTVKWLVIFPVLSEMYIIAVTQVMLVQWMYICYDIRYPVSKTGALSGRTLAFSLSRWTGNSNACFMGLRTWTNRFVSQPTCTQMCKLEQWRASLSGCLDAAHVHMQQNRRLMPFPDYLKQVWHQHV